jgi:flagellar export protein FliJ
VNRYRFRLEPVRRVRQAEERRAVTALGDASRRLLACQAAAEGAAARYRAAVAATPGATTTPAALLATRQRADLAARVRRAVEADLAAAGAAVTAARSHAVAATGRVEALDRLDRRRREEHRLATRRHEQLRVDDLVTTRRKEAR